MKKPSKRYTLGEIYRLGLLLNSKGEPYKDRASVTNAIMRAGIKVKEIQTPNGPGKSVDEADIKAHNKKMEKFYKKGK